jgi:uncharacterized repeat protein (TIGR03806 family)
MRLSFVLAPLSVITVAVLFCATRAAERPARPVGIDKRVPWTTSRVKGSPEPPDPYRAEVAFPGLPTFDEPLDMTAIPGGNRFAVAQRRGKLFTFVNDRAAKTADPLLDVKRTVYAIAFHPKFPGKPYLYVTYVLDDLKTEPKGTKIARYTVAGDPPRADPASEKILFEWPSGGHNAGCLKFGPDGYLYVGTGDGSGIADEFHTGQDVSDLLSSILRIDVDHHDPGQTYAVPKDNPFVGRQGARPEIWAYGVRQPWKFSFDRATGDLWVGEVGQDLWEMVLKIQKGGNYGWSVNEGTHPFRPERKKGPTPILPPVVEHPHSDFRSLTGGYVYHGNRLKDLVGAYVYGDFDTGRVWALRHDGKKVTWQRELTKTRIRVITFAEDAEGELFFLDFVGGRVHRLGPAPPAAATGPFPQKLSETGLFASTRDHVPAPGLIPYSVIAPLWSDHAHKERFLAIPGAGRIEFDTIVYPNPPPKSPPGWRFPDGTVLVKTFSLDLEPGNPASRRRLETRLLHFETIPGADEYGDGYWRGYTYIWNDEQTDATLADKSGLDRTFTIKEAGGEHKQTWHFPSRAECTLCHTMPSKFALGVNTLQMNKDHDYGGGRVANQLRTLEHLGLFTKPLPKAPEDLPRLVDYENERLDLNLRARSYLHANCSHCHMKWGGGNAEFQLLASLELKDLGVIDTRLGQGTFDLSDPRVLVPGHPERSMIHFRMNRLGLGRMPHIASSVIDEKGVKLVRDWIKQLPETK